MTQQRPDRRDFLKTTAAVGTTLALSAASYQKVYGANEALRIGFLGVGGRCQQHVDEILKMVKEGKAVRPVAVCDVWDGQVVPGLIKGRGLYPTAERCGLDKNDKSHVSKDYREGEPSVLAMVTVCGNVVRDQRGAKENPMLWLSLLVIRAQGSMNGVNRSTKIRRGQSVVSQRNFRTRKIS